MDGESSHGNKNYFLIEKIPESTCECASLEAQGGHMRSSSQRKIEMSDQFSKLGKKKRESHASVPYKMTLC